MSGWFDDLARRSARRAGSAAPGSGLSRREVIARGAVVAGVAWTAPMLMATQAAAAGLSVCQTKICNDENGLNGICCPNSTDTCNVDPITGAAKCTPVGDLGGSCGNEGQGVCKQPFKCNGNNDQCNNCARPNICGGEGAQCCNTQECFTDDGLVCVTQTAGTGNQRAAGFCRKPCTVATQGTDCTSSQVCSGGFCAESCTASSQCLGAATCENNVCRYQVDGGVVCPPAA